MPAVPPPSAADSPLFRGLEPEAVAELLRAAQARELPAGASLFLQGDPVLSLFVVDRGLLRLVQNTADGEEVIVRTVGPGDIVAGVAILEKRDYPVSGICETSCRVLAWPRPRIQELVARFPLLRTNIMATIADRMQESLSRIRELSTESVAQRVARTLLRLAREHGRPQGNGTLIDQPLGRQQLADLSGASMFTASRLLAAWTREGILETGRQRVALLAPERLRRIAEGQDAG
jgi:CRP-like cAMP-binding protein